MHRSGTSALAGVINIIGAYLGDNMMPNGKDNERGYYENMDMYKLNEYILEKLHSSWYDIEELILDSENGELLTLVEYVIKTTFGNNLVIAIKDPRMCLLLPIYKKILNKMGYEIHAIKTYRAENEIVSSLMARNGFAEEDCIKLITKYNKNIENENFPVVNYSDLLNNTDDVIAYLKEHLPFLNYSNENILRAKEFLDKSLKHW